MLPPPQLEESWKKALEEEWEKPYLKRLAQFLANERNLAVPIYPNKAAVFNSFQYAPFEKVRVVILGQDPYHGPGQAHGLCFSVLPGVPFPPSLQNIFKELQEDLSVPPPSNGSLVSWAKQGILMLNSILTVRAGQPQSHVGQGWEQFTDAVISKLCEKTPPIIFVLWGKKAQDKCSHILQQTENRHYVLTAAHPSPYSAYSGFFGCRHFSKINALLRELGSEPIEWKVL